MLKKLLFLSLVVLSTAALTAQTTVLDFESAATSTTFQYFGSSLEGQLTSVIANPNPTGANTSANVLEFKKPAGSQTWAGAFSNPDPTSGVNVAAGGKITVMVHFDHIGNVALKLEGSTTGGPNWILTKANTVVNGWEKLEFDVALPSVEAPNQPATGHIYPRVVLFTDFGTSPAADQVSYIDNIQVEQSVSCGNLLDFEAAATTTPFQYFGSTLDGQLSSTIANPNASGINTSANVLKFIKPAASQTWAGAFSNPNPGTPVNLSAGGTIKVKVHTDHPGNMVVKLEDSPTGGPVWALQQDITTTNEWVELSFDASLPSFEAPNQPASGHIYNRVVIFFDFGTSPTVEQVYYCDDFQVCTSGGTPTAAVEFKVNMNQYAGTYSSVNVSGSFNSWSGDANPMTDPDGDKIFTTTLNLPVGLYEYKYTLDNWGGQESLPVTSACAAVTFDGPNVFVNRKLALSGNTSLDAVCFNSCYDCGESVKINYNVGLNGATASPDGVYIAGGAEFGAPNARFRMYDDNGDGVFSLTIERERGYGGYFTLTNGLCADFSCKEVIEGLPCANPQNYNDRFLNPVQQDTIFNTCYGTCATNSDCTNGTIDLAGPGSWFELAPTLATEELRMIFHELRQSGAYISVFNVTGSLVWQQQYALAPDQVMLPVAGWQKGIYFVTAENGGRRVTGRFVKM